MSLVQIKPLQPKFLRFQSLPQTLQPSEFVIFVLNVSRDGHISSLFVTFLEGQSHFYAAVDP